MDDTTKIVETATPAAPSNEPSNTPAPVTDNKSADVEAAKKDAEQSRMRAQQLENEKKALEDKLAAVERAKLEEKEEWKTIAEKSTAELKEFREAQDRQTRQTALTAATDILFKDYPANVVDIAKTAGISLSDDSEVAKTALKEKLDSIQEKAGSSPVTPNNPHNPAPDTVDRAELTKRAAPGSPSPMALASAQGDDSVTRKYISSLPAVQEMRRQAGLSK